VITPNKFVTLKQSVLGRLHLILERANDVFIADLYHELSDAFPDINEFIYALDVLRILGRIDVNFDSGMVFYVN
jgi:hypothetical protein